jgi:hypothetical protein
MIDFYLTVHFNIFLKYFKAYELSVEKNTSNIKEITRL